MQDILEKLMVSNNIKLINKLLKKLNSYDLDAVTLQKLNLIFKDKKIYEGKISLFSRFMFFNISMLFILIFVGGIASAFIPFSVLMPLLILGGLISSKVLCDIDSMHISAKDCLKEPSEKELKKLNKNLQKLSLHLDNKHEEKEQKSVEAKNNKSLDDLILQIKDTLGHLPSEINNKKLVEFKTLIEDFENKKESFRTVESSAPNFYCDLMHQLEDELKSNLIIMLNDLYPELKQTMNTQKLISITNSLNEIVNLENKEEAIRNFGILTYQVVGTMNEDIAFNEQIKELIASYYLMILQNYAEIDLKKIICAIHPLFYFDIKRKLEEKVLNNYQLDKSNNKNLLEDIWRLSKEYKGSSVNQLRTLSI